MAESSESESFIGVECRLAELRMAGHWRHTRTRANTLKAHMHRSAFEICYVAEGAAEWWIEDRRFTVRRGQFYLTKPEELHGALESSAMPDELYWVQIAFPTSGPFSGLTEPETRRLKSQFWDVRERVFNATFDCAAIFNRVLNCLRKPSDMNAIALRGAVHHLMVGVLEDARRSEAAIPTASPAPSTRIRASLEFIEAHISDDLTVDDIAATAGIAVSHFHKVFVDQVGFTPANYRSRRRIELAKHMLNQESASITDIALELGFSSSQYFATVFKGLTGMVPRQYRAWSRQEDPLSRTAEYVD